MYSTKVWRRIPAFDLSCPGLTSKAEVGETEENRAEVNREETGENEVKGKADEPPLEEAENSKDE